MTDHVLQALFDVPQAKPCRHIEVHHASIMAVERALQDLLWKAPP